MTRRAPLAGRARDALGGATCAVGAALAHLAAGGTVEAGPFAAVALLCVATGSGLLRGAVDPARTFALALLAQVLWHVVWVLTAPAGATETSQAAMAMLGTHLVAAVLTTGVSLGLERELARACAEAVRAVLLPRPAPTAPVAARPGPGPRTPAAGAQPVPRPLLGGPLALRAPPG